MRQSYNENSRYYNRRRHSKVPYIIMGLIALFVIVYAGFIIKFAHSFNRPSFKETYSSSLPLVITTWNFTDSTTKAWEKIYTEKGSALDAVEAGCKVCEELQCDTTVGYGGSPDESSETTLDAMIMDGTTMDVGAVADLRRIKNAIGVARHVLDYTEHSILAGEQATQFAIQMKFIEESLVTNTSKSMWKKWRNDKCQPNFWKNVSPDPKLNCGPYKPKAKSLTNKNKNRVQYQFGRNNHDTIGMVVIDPQGHVVAGTSTNGAKYKIPGRVGDSPIPGSGAYADSAVGGAAATGDGDVMLRFLPSFLAVEEMRRGASPSEAGRVAINRITDRYSRFVGGLVVANNKGEYGAACHGMSTFHFAIRNMDFQQTTVQSVKCTNNVDL